MKVEKVAAENDSYVCARCDGEDKPAIAKGEGCLQVTTLTGQTYYVKTEHAEMHGLVVPGESDAD